MPANILEELQQLRERMEEFEDDTFEILALQYQEVIVGLVSELERVIDEVGVDANGNLRSDVNVVLSTRKAQGKAATAAEAVWERWRDRLERLATQQAVYTGKAAGDRKKKAMSRPEQEVAETLLGLWPKDGEAGSGVAGQFHNMSTRQRQDLADAVTRHVLGRAPKNKLVRELQEKTDRSKAQAEQVFRDATMQYSRTLQANNSDDYEFFEYRGPEDPVTRDFCRRHVGRVYTRSEIDAMDNGQTGAGTVFIAGGGYNCRHAWFPVQREWFDDDEWAEARADNLGGTGDDPDRVYGVDNWEEADDVVNQEYGMSCGAACSRQLLGDAHPDLTDDDFFDEQGDSLGLSAEQIAARIREYDSRYEGGYYDALHDITDPKKVVELVGDMFDGPFIAAQGKHWVVVESIDRRRVKLLDPWGLAGPGSGSGIQAEVTHSVFVQGLENGEYSLVGIRRSGG